MTAVLIEDYQLIAVEVSLTALAFLLVCARLYVRVLRSGYYWRWADILVVFAWISFLVQTAMDLRLYKMRFLDQNIDPWETESAAHQIEANKIYFAESVLYRNCFYAIKGSMLFFFHELTPHFRKTRWAIYICAVYCFVGWLATLGLVLFQCLPVSRWWSLINFCDTHLANLVNYLTYALHISSDLFGRHQKIGLTEGCQTLVYCIPIPILRKLHLDRSKKIGAAIMFGLGFMSMAWSLMWLVTVYTTLSAKVPLMIWLACAFEQAWAIAVPCVPAFRVLVNEVTPGARKIARKMNRRSRNSLGMPVDTEKSASSGVVEMHISAGDSMVKSGKRHHDAATTMEGFDRPESKDQISHSRQK